MVENFFTKLKKETPTRLWINNPTVQEVKLSIDHGAVSCTTNPTYGANMIRRDGEFARAVIRECLKQSHDNNIVADLVQQRLVARVLEMFRPIYDASQAHDGYVSIQGDPRADTDPDHIVGEAFRYRALGPNFIAKIPATAAGLKAMEVLIDDGMPVIATEIFALSQMVAACEMYRRAVAVGGKRPAFYVTHITGIFDEHLKEYVNKQGIRISPAALAVAGAAVARRQYRIMRERGYDGIVLGGGARGTHHFTDFVGGEFHITINWSTAEEILALNPPVTNRISIETPPAVIAELEEKLPDFRKAWREGELAVDQFAEYGPVQRFRNQFIQGWTQMLDTIKEERIKGSAR
ncbi:MAG TPA: transaldolase family protein [Candidatus Methylomirabilis sp.]|nr:transaldolase family protein [Candidatus Methylomirabilis sp.]